MSPEQLLGSVDFPEEDVVVADFEAGVDDTVSYDWQDAVFRNAPISNTMKMFDSMDRPTPTTATTRISSIAAGSTSAHFELGVFGTPSSCHAVAGILVTGT